MPVYSLMICCAAALVAWIYHRDRYEKEPWPAILLALATGFGAMWIIGQADDFAIRFLHISRDRIITKAATIALIEEGGKLFTVLFLAFVLLRKLFNDPMDGLIYGQLVGLGMAVEESLLYLSLSPATPQTLGIEIVRLFAHSLMGGIIGFAIGLGCRPDHRREHYPRLTILCVALTTTMHFAWNVAAYGEFKGIISHVLPMGLMLTLMGMWRLFCSIAESRAKKVFG
ncbi:MAG TPA: PrsW family glutamic-type intramembrane protease [Tepidisphaeraceae bacterium]|jgi:RsiW-degrading membrane proteinase PrsW (M82 family)